MRSCYSLKMKNVTNFLRNLIILFSKIDNICQKVYSEYHLKTFTQFFQFKESGINFNQSFTILVFSFFNVPFLETKLSETLFWTLKRQCLLFLFDISTRQAVSKELSSSIIYCFLGFINRDFWAQAWTSQSVMCPSSSSSRAMLQGL